MSATTTDILFQATLLSSVLLCTTCFGFLLIFAIVIMPGIGRLSDREFLKAFKAIDGIIQDRQPVFYIVWIGAVIFLVATTILALLEDNSVVDATHKALLVVATVGYLTAQVTTFTINVPLNDRVKELDFESVKDGFLIKQERAKFEDRWNFWNVFRTWVMGAVSVYLVVILSMQDSSVLF